MVIRTLKFLNMTTLTVTSLRENIYKVLDRVALLGVPQEVERKGKKIKIVLDGEVNKFENLTAHDSIIGNPESLIKAKTFIWKEPKNI